MDHNVSVTITEDPARDVGSFPRIAPAVFYRSDASSVPQFVSNWGELNGALLAITFNNERDQCILGTAFMAAPGVAISATHIFIDHLEEISAGRMAISAIGIRQSNANFWRIRKMNFLPKNDLCLLSLEAASPLPDDKTYYQFPLTTRQPEFGERIHLLGFRNEQIDDLDSISFAANLYASVGNVEDVFPRGRDATLLPFPSIRISAGSLGGMSGGIGISEDGHVLGAISLGESNDVGDGPSYLSWVIGALTRPVSSVWPAGLLKDELCLLQFDERLCFIEGRDAMIQTGENSWAYCPWHKRP